MHASRCTLLLCLRMPAGHRAMGRTGFYAVFALAFTEFFGDSLIVIIVMWQLLAQLLPDWGETPTCPPATLKQPPA